VTITWEGLIALAIGGSALLAFITALHTQVIKPLRAMVKEWELFMRDWAGEPSREGRDAVPGVMERLNNIDGELKRNGGKSIKDTVNRIEKRLIEGDRKFEELTARIAELEERVG
jgi:nitrate/nitrite-specific signal transduction histidine kinase